MSILFFYGLDEGSSGNVSGTAADQGSSALTLSYVPVSTDLQWTSDGEGSGVFFNAAAETSDARVEATINAAVVAALNSSKTFTFVFKRGSSLTADYYATRFYLGASGGSPAILYEYAGGPGLHIFSIMGNAFLFYNGSEYTVISVDTAQAAMADRVKIYGWDGVDTVVPITPDGGYGTSGDNFIAQDAVISGLSTSDYLTIGNRPTGGLNPAGTIKAVALDTTALDSAAVESLMAALDVDDDVSWAGGGGSSTSLLLANSNQGGM